MCILHSLKEALGSISIEVALEEIKSILKLELLTNKYYRNLTTSVVNISDELQLFVNSQGRITKEIPLICSCLDLVSSLVSTFLYSNRIKENVGLRI